MPLKKYPYIEGTLLFSQVTPAFSKNPVLKQAERLKKMTDAEEQAARKAEMAAAMAQKSINPDGETAPEADGGAAVVAPKKAARVRPEAEIIDSRMDFKKKKSGAVDRSDLAVLLVELGFGAGDGSGGGGDAADAAALDAGGLVTTLAKELDRKDEVSTLVLLGEE
jgi:hypothetical protein